MGVPPPEANLCGALFLRQASGAKLRTAIRSNISWVHRYELSSILKGHHGCVNTIQWSHDARLLVSGSDDRHVKLWSLEGGSSGVLSPLSSLPTMHRHNIFDAQMTRSQQTIVSCGADGCVCATEAEASESRRRLLYEPDMGHYLASKLAFMKHVDGDAFLVTFGDGRVRMFDLREREHRIAVETNGVGLTGIELCPTNSVLLALGGNDPFLRLYDLRTLSFDREASELQARREAPATAPVSLHTAPRLLDPRARQRRAGTRFWSSSSDVAISGVSWSPDGQSLLANYRSSDVVLFDMSQRSGAPGPADEREQPGAEGAEAEAACPVVDSPEARDEFDLPTERIHLNAVRTFEGRVNEQTCAKEVRFLCGASAVATGGDCGSFFIWEASSGRLLRKLPADRCVVNCVAPHPTLPLVCTSGIDAEIKVWDVGDGRVCGTETRKRTSPEDCGSSSDWGRRRREGAPNATAAEAEERTQAAERRKQRGNALVRQGSWDEALEQYCDALQDLHFLAPNRETQLEREALANSCRLNCAFCHLNLEEYALAVEDCDKVLDSDEDNVKARFRRAAALGELREFDRAFEDLEAALHLDPGNGELSKLRAKLQKQQRQHQKRERSFYKRLFSCATAQEE